MNTLSSKQRFIGTSLNHSKPLGRRLNRQRLAGNISFAMRILLLFLISLSFHSRLSFAAPSPADSVRIANFTGLTDQALSEFFARTLKPELKELIKRNNLAVFTFTAVFDGKRACYGVVGLTEAPPQGRNARYPAHRDALFRVNGIKDEWNASKCESDSLTSLTETLNETAFEKLLDGIEDTKSIGKVSQGKPPNKNTARVRTYVGSSRLSDESLFKIVHSFDFGDVFDYRQVETVVATNGVKMSNGDFMCVAFAGISSRSPEDRRSRWPGYWKGFVRLQTGGDISACQLVVAEQAVKELLNDPWTPKGLLKNFAATREDGVGLPDPLKVAKAKALIDRASKPVPVSASTRSTNYVSCTNSCENGSCLRRFADGRTERWQAPRKFNPFENNWEWDITTNPCGL